MKDLAAFVLRNRLAAALTASLGAALPLMGIVGGAACGLVTLHRGFAEGMLTAGLGSAVAAGLTWVLGGNPALAVLLVLWTTVPVCALGWMLRRWVSLPLTVQTAAIAGCAVVAVVFLGLEDPAAFWRQAAEAWLAAAGQNGEGLNAAERQQLLERLPFDVLTGSVVANVMLLTVGSLFLARSAQARLMNPGGFRREFHALRLGRLFLLASGALVLLTALAQTLAPLNMMAVVLAAWLLQGLSVAHHVVAVMGLATGWLVFGYAALVFAAIFASPAVLLFPVMGAVDELFDFRGRLGRARQGRDDRGD